MDGIVNAAPMSSAQVIQPPMTPTASSSPSAAAGRSSLRRWLWLALRIALSGGLLIWLFASVDLAEAWAVLIDADFKWLGVLALVLAGGRFVNGLRWYLLLRGVEPAVRYGEVMRVFFMSSFLGQFMPGVAGMEAIRVVALGRSISNTALALASVLVDRILGFFSLVFVVLIALAVTPVELDPAIRYAVWAGLACLVAGSAALFSIKLRRLMHLLLPRPVERIIGAKLQKVYRCIDAYRKVPWLVGLVFLLSLLAQVFTVIESMTLAWALHINQVAWQYYFVFVPIIFFLLMLPITIAGLGVREVAYTKLFGTVGMAAPQALTLSLMMMVLVRVMSLPGVYFVIVARKKVRDTVDQAKAFETAAPAWAIGSDADSEQ